MTVLLKDPTETRVHGLHELREARVEQAGLLMPRRTLTGDAGPRVARHRHRTCRRRHRAGTAAGDHIDHGRIPSTADPQTVELVEQAGAAELAHIGERLLGYLDPMALNLPSSQNKPASYGFALDLMARRG
ncbi:MAG TPA: hypothetical protein VJ757_08630 [Pseudonocardiaceae bacterium]|nr:hypothetical protein [Pseudonocardiaceae bacterium]